MDLTMKHGDEGLVRGPLRHCTDQSLFEVVIVFEDECFLRREVSEQRGDRYVRLLRHVSHADRVVAVREEQIEFSRFGGPDVLRLVDAEEPHAGPGQVRITVRSAGVNAHDWRAREGRFRGTFPPRLPAGVGLDASGVVDEVGEGVEGFRLGARVFGERIETYAEHAVLTAWAPMPHGLSFDVAAGYASIAEASLRLIEQVGVQPGQTLLVVGASGGMGSMILQIARDLGVAVIGTAGPQNLGYVRQLGASATSYHEGWADRVRDLGDVDAALDLAGSGVIPDLIDLVGSPDRVVSIADLEAPAYGARVSGTSGDVPQALEKILDLIRRDALYVPIARRYALADAAEAHRDSQAGHTRGRRVLIVSEPTAAAAV
jgi:NADPH:quinone reductase-like Zn-dependent oxidoreductase